MKSEAHARQCNNVNCRVLTYSAAMLLPLATCPQCNVLGTMTEAPSALGHSVNLEKKS